MVHSNHSLFAIAPCKVIALYLLCNIFGMISFYLFIISLSIVIAVPTIKIAIFFALTRSERRSDNFFLVFAIAFTIEKK